MRKSRFLILALLTCLLIALAATSGSAHANEPDPCALADLLKDMGFADDAKALYIDVLAETKSEFEDCAKEGLKAMAPEPTPTATPTAETGVSENVVLLADSLTLVGEKLCPGPFECGIRYLKGSVLAVPLANSTTNLAGLPSADEPIGLLSSSDSGHAVSVWRKGPEKEQGLVILPLKAPGLERGNGSYEGSFDLLPADEKKGSFKLTVKLRDLMLWPIVAVLAGVYISNVVRIWYNKYLPVRNLEGRRYDLANSTKAAVTPQLTSDEKEWERFLRPYGMEPPDDDIDKWVKALRRYSIIDGCSGRLNTLKDNLEKVYENAQIEAISPDSTQTKVKELYEGLQAEQTLLNSLNSLGPSVLFPAHFAFMAADAKREEARLTMEDLPLLKVAKEKLYVEEKSDPEEIKNSGQLSALRSEIEVLTTSLEAMRQVFHRWGEADDLRRTLAPKFGTMPHAKPDSISTAGPTGDEKPPEPDNVVDPESGASAKPDSISTASPTDDDRKRYYEASGQVLAVRDIMKLVMGGKELQDMVPRLDEALATLRGLAERYPTERPRPKAAEEEPVRLGAVTGRVGSAPTEFTVPWRQAFYRFRWAPATLSLAIAVFAALVTLYFGKDKTFGSLADYVGALAWGLGVDTASRGVPAVLKALGVVK